MNFFEHQDNAHRKTRSLIGIFILTVILIIGVIYGMIIFVLGLSGESLPLFQPTLLLIVAGIVSSIVGFGSFFKIATLRSGGSAVAEALGGKLIPVQSEDPQLRTLLNVVEEMAIASGVSVPAVYLVEEDSINAFAAGYTPDSAVIGITQGAVAQLSRDELQGVIAHEFSHILNGDMRLNIRLIGVLHGLFILSLIGRHFLASAGRQRRYSSSRKNSDAALPFVAGLTLITAGWLGVLGGRLIKAAISRQREFLADASAVQFTRNPHGIANALRKIGVAVDGSKIRNPEAEAFSHLFFASGLSKNWIQLFATHPPLSERIERLDPSGSFTPAQSSTAQSLAEQKNGLAIVQLASPDTGIDSSEEWTTTIGTMLPSHLQRSQEFLERTPQWLLDLAHRESGAQALVIYCLVLHRDSGIRSLLEELQNDPHIGEDLLHLQDLLAQQPTLFDDSVIPLLEIAAGTIAAIDGGAKESFLATVRELIATDSRITLFEYMLHRMFIMQMSQPASRTPQSSKEAAQQAIYSLLSLVALHSSQREKERAYAKARTRYFPQLPAIILRTDTDALTSLDSALTTLEGRPPLEKERILSAVELIIRDDSIVTQKEVELFRSVGAALGCPVPYLSYSFASSLQEGRGSQ
ncbi:MAG: M48 family metallopeptidase [Bdellovibrionota bacterium]